jgi:DNA polymerase III epsilon subunit-like protein
MSFIVVDVEADGPMPGSFSMVSFGAVIVREGLNDTFYGKVSPISEEWVPEALAVSGHTREEHLTFQKPETVMREFSTWILENSRNRPVFVSDNLAFDWQWINYYMHRFCGKNPFGHSGRRIGDLYAGLVKDARKGSDWKKFRKTKHTHNPVDDAKGNAEAIFHIRGLGLRIDLT